MKITAHVAAALSTAQSVFDTYRSLAELHTVLQEYEVLNGGREVIPEVNRLMCTAFIRLFDGGTVEEVGYEDGNLMLVHDSVLELIESSFPQAVVIATTGPAEDGTAVHHVSVRPAFMQDHATNDPLPSGSSVNHSLTIALMQAAVRMYMHLLVQRQLMHFYPIVHKTNALHIKPLPNGTLMDQMNKKGGQMQRNRQIMDVLESLGFAVINADSLGIRARNKK